MLQQFFYVCIQQTFCRLYWCDSGAWIFLLNGNFTSTRHPSLFQFYRKYLLNFKKKSQYHGKRFHISIYLMSGVMMITMKEESWIWETGSRINLRLAEVWAEKAEIGKNCWHWFPPLSLQYCEQPINRPDLKWRFPDSFISHIGKSRCLAYQRFRLDFQ